MTSAKSADRVHGRARRARLGRIELPQPACTGRREQPASGPRGPAGRSGKQAANRQVRGSLPGWRQVAPSRGSSDAGVKTAPRIPISSMREPSGRQKQAPNPDFSTVSDVRRHAGRATPCHDHQHASQPTTNDGHPRPRFRLTAAAKTSVHAPGSGRQASPDRTEAGRPRPADGPGPPPRAPAPPSPKSRWPASRRSR